MRWMKAGSLGLVLIAALPAAAQSQDGIWWSGSGMGVHEAGIEHGPGSQIYVACHVWAPGPSGISFRLVGEPPADGRVMLIFDGETPFEIGVSWQGYVHAGCRVCDQLFQNLINGFKSHQTVWVSFGGGIDTTFTLNGAAEAIGDCPLYGPE